MRSVHFPCVEAGRPRPLCGDLRAPREWTLDEDRVTCARCAALLRTSAERDRDERLRAPAIEPFHAH